MYQTEIPVARSVPTRMPPHRGDTGFGGDVPVIDIPALIATLCRRRRLIYVTLAAVMLATLAFVLLRSNTFTATTRILMDPRGLYVVDKELNPAATTGETNTAQVENQMRVLISDRVLSRVVEREGLAGDIEFGAKPPSLLGLPMTLLRAALGKKSGSDAPEAKALRLLRSAVYTERPQGSYVVDLFVSTQVPEKSARIANAIAATYVESELGVRSDAAQRVSRTLAERAEELRHKVREAEQKVEAYRQANDILDVSTAGANDRPLSQEQLTQMNQQVSLARARVSQAKAKVDQIEKLRAGSGAFTDVVQSATITQLRTRYSAAREAEASLATTLGPRHPRLVAARAQVRDIEATINAEIDLIARSARGDLERARADEADLVARLESLKTTSVKSNQAQVRLRELEREANASRGVYESFLVRSREISEQKGLDTSSDRVLSPAVAPVDADGPRGLFLLALAAVFALGLGSVLALVREQFDDRVRTGAQVTALTGLPVMVTVPDVTVAGSSTAGPSDGAQALLFSDSLPAVVFHNRGSAGAAAFRRLDGILRNTGHAISLRTILVTSAGTSDGKSTVAVNMAVAAMETGDRVLLVDGDTARHTLSTIAGVPSTGTLGTTYPVVPGTGPGLAFAPAASVGITGDAVADVRTVRNAIVQLAGDYDTIIIDGDVLGTAMSLGALAEAASDIVMVARAGATRSSALAQALPQVGHAIHKIRGCVFLDV